MHFALFNFNPLFPRTQSVWQNPVFRGPRSYPLNPSRRTPIVPAAVDYQSPLLAFLWRGLPALRVLCRSHRFTASRRAPSPTASLISPRCHRILDHCNPLVAAIAIPARQRAKRSAQHLFRFGNGVAFPFVRKRIGSLLVETKIRIQRPKGPPTPRHLDRW